ncbi:MAG: nucleotidyl transferase AbiEii/AbiGii toxin family protein [Candidatus Omnitrophota bacterium]
MFELLRQQFKNDDPVEVKINKAREFLQNLALKIAYDKNLFDSLAFVGGTALRVLFDLRRFSEDLDFSVINKKRYKFPAIKPLLEKQFNLYGLAPEINAKSDKNVHSLLLKFGGLLRNLGLSGLSSQKLSIKIEIDSNPPLGWKTESTLVNKTYLFNIVHFDLASLYSTKLHACFYRRFRKGRDFYDFIWYLSKKIKPNFLLLNNAITQTHGAHPVIGEHNFKGFLLENAKKVDFNEMRKDVERFLEDKGELGLLEKNNVLRSINAVYG